MSIFWRILILKLTYGLFFLILFCIYDKALRKQKCKYRKTREVTLCLIHSICLLIISYYNQKYMEHIIPTAISLFVFSLFIIFANKDGNGGECMSA